MESINDENVLFLAKKLDSNSGYWDYVYSPLLSINRTKVDDNNYEIIKHKSIEYLNQIGIYASNDSELEETIKNTIAYNSYLGLQEEWLAYYTNKGFELPNGISVSDALNMILRLTNKDGMPLNFYYSRILLGRYICYKAIIVNKNYEEIFKLLLNTISKSEIYSWFTGITTGFTNICRNCKTRLERLGLKSIDNYELIEFLKESKLIKDLNYSHPNFIMCINDMDILTLNDSIDENREEGDCPNILNFGKNIQSPKVVNTKDKAEAKPTSAVVESKEESEEGNEANQFVQNGRNNNTTVKSEEVNTKRLDSKAEINISQESKMIDEISAILESIKKKLNR